MPREKISRAARFALKYLKTRVGGSEKKVAAKATAARKLHYATGGTGNHDHLAGLDLTSANLHQLLLRTVIGAESYPPFALLPLLRLEALIHNGATYWPADHLPYQRYHVKPPCFAACPLYAKARPQSFINFPVRLHTTPQIKVGVTPKTELPSHPLFKYAALGRVQLIQSVPVSSNRQVALRGLHTYAALARPMPAINQADCIAQHIRQSLQKFAQLDRKPVGQYGRRSLSAKAADTRSALKSYAQLDRRS
ncbi:TPA: hypothetical protein ACH3X1_008171 [Trebouxia sp. C0004]